mgnify:CR=1 FL=1
MKGSIKLIEVALPLAEINDASAYDKMPGIGPHPKGIHHWWARLPLPVARAVLFASVVDDPSAHPDRFPSEEAQQQERERLFGIIRRMMQKQLHKHPEVYAEARAEMLKHCDGRLPVVFDPFAGGGSIPLEAAQRQRAANAVAAAATAVGAGGAPAGPTPGPGPGGMGLGRWPGAAPPAPPGQPGAATAVARPQRFHGSVALDPLRLTRDVGKIAEEVVQHLTGLLGAEAEVTLEITVRMPDGVPDHVVRTVTENCRTLKFRSHGFEPE